MEYVLKEEPRESTDGLGLQRERKREVELSDPTCFISIVNPPAPRTACTAPLAPLSSLPEHRLVLKVDFNYTCFEIAGIRLQNPNLHCNKGHIVYKARRWLVLNTTYQRSQQAPEP